MRALIVAAAAAFATITAITAQTPNLTAPFDPAVFRLPTHFKGHDINALLRAIEYAPSLKDKGEFETSAAYNARLEAFTGHLLYGSLHAHQTVALVLPQKTPHSDEAEATFEYSADTQTLTAFFRPGTESDSGFPSVTLAASGQNTGSYIATNGFGAHTRVIKYKGQSFGIAFPSDTRTGLGRILEVPMTPESARLHKPGLRMLLIVQPVSPWANYAVDASEATFDEPFETSVGVHNLYAKLISIWLFDQNSGEILLRVDADPEECQGATKPSDEPYANCVKRLREWKQQCTNAGGSDCVDEKRAQWQAEQDARRKALPLCKEVRNTLQPCRWN